MELHALRVDPSPDDRLALEIEARLANLPAMVGSVLEETEQALATPDDPMFYLFAIFLLPIVLAIFYVMAKIEQARDESKVAYITSLAVEHLRTLVTRRRSLVSRDPYGGLDIKAWRKEVIEVFLKRNLSPTLEPRLQFWLSGKEASVFDALEEIVSREQCEQDAAFAANAEGVDVDSMDPLDFEKFCARLLESGTWKTNLTRRTGDQGIDILAVRDGFTAVFQVKFSTGAVGNKAVQEAFAGKQLVRARGAAVVSNAKFTKSAFQLAESTGVLLLDFHQLSTLKVSDFPPQPS